MTKGHNRLAQNQTFVHNNRDRQYPGANNDRTLSHLANLFADAIGVRDDRRVNNFEGAILSNYHIGCKSGNPNLYKDYAMAVSRYITYVINSEVNLSSLSMAIKANPWIVSFVAEICREICYIRNHRNHLSMARVCDRVWPMLVEHFVIGTYRCSSDCTGLWSVNYQCTDGMCRCGHDGRKYEIKTKAQYSGEITGGVAIEAHRLIENGTKPLSMIICANSVAPGYENCVTPGFNIVDLRDRTKFSVQYGDGTLCEKNLGTYDRPNTKSKTLFTNIRANPLDRRNKTLFREAGNKLHEHKEVIYGAMSTIFCGLIREFDPTDSTAHIAHSLENGLDNSLANLVQMARGISRVN